MTKFLIIIEETSTGFSSYSPDIPGCVSTGRTREEAEQNMREAIAFHLEGLRDDGQPLPKPTCGADCVLVASAMHQQTLQQQSIAIRTWADTNGE